MNQSLDDSPAAELHVLATTFRDATTDERETRAADIAAIGTGFAERVVLETCHRVEVIGVGPAVPATGLHAYRGHEAIAHVFALAAGFDSAVVAEEQVLGQVRDAYEAALARGQTGPLTNELFRRAIRFGKRVRTEARPGTDRSLADRASDWLVERAPPGGALVVGTGEMGYQIAARLVEAGWRVTIASRTEERAALVRDRLPGGPVATATWPAAAQVAAEYDVVAIAVRSAAARLALAGDGRLPYVVDLSTPPGVTPESRVLLGERLLDLDALGAAPGRAPFPPAVERRLRAQLDAEVDRFVAWLGARAAGDSIALLRDHAEEIRQRHLDRLRRRAGLDPEQARAVEAATAAIVGELLHGPTVELRSGPDAAARVRQVFGFDR